MLLILCQTNQLRGVLSVMTGCLFTPQGSRQPHPHLHVHISMKLAVFHPSHYLLQASLWLFFFFKYEHAPHWQINSRPHFSSSGFVCLNCCSCIFLFLGIISVIFILMKSFRLLCILFFLRAKNSGNELKLLSWQTGKEFKNWSCAETVSLTKFKPS